MSMPTIPDWAIYCYWGVFVFVVMAELPEFPERAIVTCAAAPFFLLAVWRGR